MQSNAADLEARAKRFAGFISGLVALLAVAVLDGWLLTLVWNVWAAPRLRMAPMEWWDGLALVLLPVLLLGPAAWAWRGKG